MTLPNFLVIGSGKSGTSSLYYYFKQHPEIYMSPKKEARFFSLMGRDLNYRGPDDEEIIEAAVTDMESYLALFDGVKGERAIGEASPEYIYIDGTAECIKEYVPDVKLIAILRHPADRAFSNYMSRKAKGHEPLPDFGQALKEEKGRIEGNWSFGWHYKAQGYYFKLLKRYYNLFDRKQIKVVLYDDLVHDAEALMKDLFCFLEVDDSFLPDVKKILNPSGIPRNRFLYQLGIMTYKDTRATRLIRPLFKLFIPKGLVARVRYYLTSADKLYKAQIPEAIRGQLIEEYREDIRNLQELIQRDLSHWLK